MSVMNTTNPADKYRVWPGTTTSPGPTNPGNATINQDSLPGSNRDYRTGVGNVIDLFVGQNKTRGQNLADAGSAISGVSQGEKDDRILRGNWLQNYDQMMMDREQGINDTMLRAQDSRNSNELDALKKLRATSYIKGATSDYTPTSISLGGTSRALPSFGFGPKKSSAEEIAGASTLQDTIMSRFGEDGSYRPEFNYNPTDPTEYTKPGAIERISSYGGAAVSGAGSIMDMMNRNQTGAPGQSGSTMGRVQNAVGTGMQMYDAAKNFGLIGNGANAANTANAAGATGATAGGVMGNMMGKVVPIAGAVTGGIGLMKDRGLGTNMMNGASTGASIGTMVMPGIGTAVGAGIGAGVGALRGIGGPSSEEQAGRQASSQGRQGLTASATPKQMQEAQQSGFQNPEEALTMIVVRDMLAQAGKPADAAGSYVQALWRAEKQGPQAVAQALNTIYSAVGMNPPQGPQGPGGPSLPGGTPGGLQLGGTYKG